MSLEIAPKINIDTGDRSSVRFQDAIFPYEAAITAGSQGRLIEGMLALRA